MGIPMGLQCSITAIGSVVLQGAVNGLGSDIVAAQTAGGKAAQFLCVPLESIGTAMTTYASQNMGAKDLDRVDRGVYTALGIGCVYSIASFLILRVTDKLLIGLFLDASETAIMANARASSSGTACSTSRWRCSSSTATPSRGWAIRALPCLPVWPR